MRRTSKRSPRARKSRPQSCGSAEARRAPGGARGLARERPGLEPRARHLLAEAVEAPRPDRRDAAVVEVPAVAAGGPDRALRGLRALGLEALGRGFGRAERLAAPGAQQLDELQHVGELQLRDFDQREVSDRTVRA